MRIYVYLSVSKRIEKTKMDEATAAQLAQNLPQLIIFYKDDPWEDVGFMQDAGITTI